MALSTHDKLCMCENSQYSIKHKMHRKLTICVLTRKLLHSSLYLIYAWELLFGTGGIYSPSSVASSEAKCRKSSRWQHDDTSANVVARCTWLYSLCCRARMSVACLERLLLYTAHFLVSIFLAPDSFSLQIALNLCRPPITCNEQHVKALAGSEWLANVPY